MVKSWQQRLEKRLDSGVQLKPAYYGMKSQSTIERKLREMLHECCGAGYHFFLTSSHRLTKSYFCACFASALSFLASFSRFLA